MTTTTTHSATATARALHAIACAPATVAARREAAREAIAGGRSRVPVAEVDAALAEVARIAALRELRSAASAAAATPTPTARLRLQLRRQRAKALATAAGADQWGVGADWSWSREEETSWDKYSKGWHRRYGPARWVTTTLRCSAPALDRPCPLRGQVLGGLLTLDATEEAPGLYRARWVVPRRGKNAWIARGFIALCGMEHAAHGDTREEAETLLERRMRRLLAAPATSEAERLQRRVLRLRRHWEVPVDVAASRAAGNCRDGSIAWAARHLDGAEVAPVRAILLAALTCGEQVDLAVAACEAAVKRARARSPEVAAAAAA